MNKELWIGIGLPGAGKSTYFKNFANKDSVKYVSRDEIRFSIINENDAYFSKENLVFSTFIDTIVDGLNSTDKEVVIADATHLNVGSRKKLLNAIKQKTDISFTAIGFFFIDNVDDCLERNELRQGTRAYVPPNVINDMVFSLSAPQKKENIESTVFIKNGYKLYEKPSWL